LWNTNPELRKKVLTEACPRNLLALLGLETLLQRVPETYTRAIFAAFLASRYVYHADHSASPEFSFFHFITNYMKQ
jgi:glutamate dehydrogenase